MRAIINTIGLIEENQGSNIEKEEYEANKRMYDFLNQKVAVVEDWTKDMNEYGLLWLVNDDENKEFWWLVEQIPSIGIYRDRKEFDKLWEAGEYDGPGCSLHLPVSAVKIIN